MTKPDWLVKMESSRRVAEDIIDEMLSSIFSSGPNPTPTPAEIVNRIVCSSDIGVENILGELISNASEALKKSSFRLGEKPRVRSCR